MPRITFTVYSHHVRELRPDFFLPVFDICDILCIQEAWSAIQDAFCSIVVSATDCKIDYLITGHPPGGVAIFWCTHLGQNIKLIDIECDGCNTIEFNIGVNTVVIINGGETQRVTCTFFFFSDHFFIFYNLCMHQLNSNSIL